VAWFRKAAEQDLGWAQYYLGLAYAQGRGVSRDRRAAIEWMREAAGQGYTEALVYLGSAYLDGTGVKRDLAQAVYWLALAARDGHAPAAARLQQTISLRSRARPPATTEIRSAADAAASVIRTAGGKAYAYVLERDDEWVRVYFEDDHTVGYVRADELRAKRR
jgi:TPR repeat protein